MAQLQNLLTKVSEAFAFVCPGNSGDDDESVAQFLNDALLAPWRTKLKKIRRMKPAHSFRTRGTAARARGHRADGYDDHVSQLTNVDMNLALCSTSKAANIRSHKVFQFFPRQHDHALRKRAFHQFYEEFKRPPIYPRLVTRLFGQSRCFRARRAKVSFRAEASLFRDDVPQRFTMD